MFGIIKGFMTFSFLVLCGALLFLAWLMSTPVTAHSVEIRLVQGCLISNMARIAEGMWNQKPLMSRWVGLSQCRCTSAQIVDIAGAKHAGRLADSMRLHVLETLKSMAYGYGARAAQYSPHVADARRLADVAVKAYGVCNRGAD
jgi:hypothetical protein